MNRTMLRGGKLKCGNRNKKQLEILNEGMDGNDHLALVCFL